MTRLFDILPDISLDVPNANAIMDKILNSCHAKGFVSEDIMDMAPNRLEKENIFHKIKKFTLKIISLKKTEVGRGLFLKEMVGVSKRTDIKPEKKSKIFQSQLNNGVIWNMIYYLYQ